MKYIKLLYKIYKELKKQDKKQFTTEFDVKVNSNQQLINGIQGLAKTCYTDKRTFILPACPENWNQQLFKKQLLKSNKEKLIIIAAWAIKEILRYDSNNTKN